MKKILLIGKNGQVGHELVGGLAPIGNMVICDRHQIDLARPDMIRARIREIQPDIIVNAAGYTSVDGAEAEPAVAMAANAVAPGIIAEETRRLDALLVHYSTDYVFDGTRTVPYVEDDAPNPINAYGRSKLAGERAILDAGCRHLILRASWIYSSRGTNFVLAMLRLARERKELFVVNDQIGSPSWARTLAQATVELLRKAMPGTDSATTGIYHLSAPDYVSRLDFAQKILDIAQSISGKTTGWADLNPTTTADFPLPAARPLRATTSKEKIRRDFGVEMPAWEVQLDAFMRESAGRLFSGIKD